MSPSPSSSRSATPLQESRPSQRAQQLGVQGDDGGVKESASGSHKTFSISSYYYSAPLQESPKRRRMQPVDVANDPSNSSGHRNLQDLQYDQQKIGDQKSFVNWSEGVTFGDDHDLGVAGPSRLSGDERDDVGNGAGYLSDGPQPGDSVSYLGPSRQGSFVMGGDGPLTANSEGAFLKDHSAPIGYGQVRPTILVDSPADDLQGKGDYFEDHRARVELEDGDRNAPQRSSADMYNRLGISNNDGRPGQARQGLGKVGKSIRRMSRRVINLDNERPPAEGRIRLPDNDQDSDAEDDGVIAVQELRYEAAVAGLRGKSLGVFGPNSGLRQSLASLMSEWWIEPFILAMILINVVLLIIQSSRNVFNHPLKPGYFDYWEDYAILSIFVAYTIEAFARIIVSGLIINPPTTYEAAGVSSSPDEDGAPETPYAQHMRDNTARSNTADVFAELGDTIKARATEVVRPHNHLGHIRKNGRAISPNRISAPRIVASDALDPASSTSEAMTGAPQGMTRSALWEDKTSKFLQKSRLAPFAEAILKQRAQAVDYAFLRHSWNRVDLVAVVAFWISFILAMLHEELRPTLHLRVFRALSVLRCARLLTATRGTSVILRSLKTAGPLLINVAFFTIFAMLLFSIIGVQSFEGDYLRTCVVVGDLLSASVPSLAGQNFTLQQLCGGHIDPMSGQVHSAIRTDGTKVPISAKGFICPLGQYCIETTESPENSTENFDNIFTSLLQVIIVISSNGWSTIMYNMMDADFYASCLYFILGIIVMNFWMANLFVAVITNTFATISSQTKQSAFAAERIEQSPKQEIQGQSAGAQRRRRVANVFKRFWGYTKYFWLALIVADLGVQASQASYHRSAANAALDVAELYLTLAFDVEILMRFLSYLLDNDWRAFFAIKRNRFDLFLAVVTTIIQIPPVKNSGVFPWLTVFQLARFYRVIAAVPRMESMLIRVFGSMSGLFNMILFLLLIVALASVMAAQLFRGDIPAEYEGETNEINFKHMWNSFLGMYQIFSSENWTTPLYSVLQVEGQYQQAVIGGLFLCAWFLFANFIVLQMFIAVIAENFGIAESQKRSQQLERYLRNLEKPKVALIVRFLHHLSPYRWLRERNAAKMGENAEDDQPETRVGAQHALDTIDEKATNRFSKYANLTPSKVHWAMGKVRTFLLLDKPVEQVPLDTIRARQFRQSFSGASMLGARNPLMRSDSFLSPNSASPAGAPVTPYSEETARLFARDRQLRRMRSDLGLSSEQAPNQEQVNEMHANRLKDDPRIAQARLINIHPSYEKSLWLFSNLSQFRRTCQSFVPCSYGERLFGRPTSRARLRVYQAIIFSTIAASVIIAGVATPAYRRYWYTQHGFRRDSWFSMTEIMLSLIFIAEFIIKIVADGFAFTPNAYLLSPWNTLDLFVLLTLIVNVSSEIAVIGGVSRFTRALKAFRALRLINLSDFMRKTFSALVAVSGRFIDASILAILYIVPFAIWGQNLFSGLLYSCTDTSSSILTKADCVNEYSASPSEWTFLAPRVWQNPTQGSVYSFDDFRSSLLILFEIVSLEGWTNVMATAMSVAGFDQQLQTDSRQINALFFVIYNLIGAIFVLTLFVAVIIESFQGYSGAAFLTTAQKQWIDLKRLISRQRPSKRPKMPPTGQVRKWCYDRAVHKHGWWSRSMTVLYLVSLVTLATQRYSDSNATELIRDVIYISLTIIFALDIVIRLVGVGWRAYRSDVWNIFDLIVVSGTLITSIPLLSPNVTSRAMVQLQKFFLVAVAFKLVQKNNPLNQLFKTAVSSLPSIASLFVLWLTFFLVWGIMLVEVFGLTAWGMNETYNKNFTSLLRALVFLSMMSTGEGWNQYMHDFTTTSPNCNASTNYLNTDCGSEGWAYFLFVGWNVISMYIFLNMFTATVVENFSYVFQLGGKPKLSREQVRNFKKAWTEMDVERTGYLPKEKFVPFFKKLEGSLHVSVYPPEASIKALKSKAMSAKLGRPRSLDASSYGSKSPTREGKMRLLRSPINGGSNKNVDDTDGQDLFVWPPSPSEITVDGLNIASLRRQLGKLDLTEIRRRKHRFERLFTEACILSEKPENEKKGGLPFNEVLLLLAHYKLIDDEQALSVEELVERRELMERVEDRIETQRVRRVLRQIWLRRRFLAMLDARDQQDHVRLESGDVGDVAIPSLVSPPPDLSTRVAPTTIPAIRIDSYLGGSTSNGHGSSDTARGRPVLHLNLGHLSRKPLASVDDSSLDSANDRKPAFDNSLLSAANESPAHSPSRPIFASGELSPATTMSDLERRASPTIQEIDTSAWGSLARRLSSESNATGGAASTQDLTNTSSASSHARQSATSGLSALRTRLANFVHVPGHSASDDRYRDEPQPEMVQSDRESTPSLGRRSSGQQSMNREW